MKDGIMDKQGFIDKIVATLNCVSVSGVRDVVALANVFQMLSTLKSGLRDEDSAKDQTIELLKEQLKRATESTPEDGGDVVGGEHYSFDYGIKKDGGGHGTD